ncbi:uroporphyrinogen decarboxylase family protein [Thermatribacter velox]|uniref:Uroporphyrinogen decarboxylase family protein n=1 Tax=Thermatribacter velox TaxID=3039681 RepID=A0ABZ2YAT7_9BACT
MISNDLEEEANVIYRNEEVVEIHLFKSTNKMVFREVFVAPRDDAPWLLERPVKAFEDWIEYKKFLFPPSFEIVAEEIEEAYKETGDAGIVSLAISGLFFDLLISSREGGLEKVFEDLFEHPSFFKRLHREFIDHTKEKMKAICKVTKKFDEFFVGCSYSAIPIINPKLYREWEIPFLREITEFAHMFGKPLHLHQHGRVMGIIEDIAEAGVDLLCPLESPPLGDVDLGLVKRRFGDRLALKGNVRTRVLCEGTLGEIEAEVKDCIYKAASGGGFVLGTGDQVHRDTPFENIVFMRELCKRYGSYPISVTSG